MSQPKSSQSNQLIRPPQKFCKRLQSDKYFADALKGHVNITNSYHVLGVRLDDTAGKCNLQAGLVCWTCTPGSSVPSVQVDPCNRSFVRAHAGMINAPDVRSHTASRRSAVWWCTTATRDGGSLQRAA